MPRATIPVSFSSSLLSFFPSSLFSFSFSPLFAEPRVVLAFFHPYPPPQQPPTSSSISISTRLIPLASCLLFARVLSYQDNISTRVTRWFTTRTYRELPSRDSILIKKRSPRLDFLSGRWDRSFDKSMRGNIIFSGFLCVNLLYFVPMNKFGYKVYSFYSFLYECIYTIYTKNKININIYRIFLCTHVDIFVGEF